MFQSPAKKLGALAATTIIAATAVQGVLAAPADAFSSSGPRVAVPNLHIAAPYAVNAPASQAELMVLQQINDYRAQHGIAPIIQDNGFSNGAREWAQYLTDTGQRPGHPDGGYFFENVAYAMAPERAVGLWKNSEGHNRNMLERKITHGGVGIVARPDGNYAVVFRGLWEPAGVENSKGRP